MNLSSIYRIKKPLKYICEANKMKKEDIDKWIEEAKITTNNKQNSLNMNVRADRLLYLFIGDKENRKILYGNGLQQKRIRDSLVKLGIEEDSITSQTIRKQMRKNAVIDYNCKETNGDNPENKTNKPIWANKRNFIYYRVNPYYVKENMDLRKVSKVEVSNTVKSIIKFIKNHRPKLYNLKK